MAHAGFHAHVHSDVERDVAGEQGKRENMGGQDDGAQAEEVGAGPGSDGGRVGGRHAEVYEGGEGDGLGESAYVATQRGMGKES